jgi:hypothetical protein
VLTLDRKDDVVGCQIVADNLVYVLRKLEAKLLISF